MIDSTDVAPEVGLSYRHVDSAEDQFGWYSDRSNGKGYYRRCGQRLTKIPDQAFINQGQRSAT